MSPIDYQSTTALITGASSGLGAEFARQLAARGSDLVLVARRADRLDALASELRTAHGVTVTTLPFDLTVEGAGQALLDAVTERELDIHTLVNNAGFGTHGRFWEEDAARIREEIQLNVVALVDLAHTFLPQLMRHGDGALINVASTAGFQPVPGMAVYGATKAFVLSFTEALWAESRSSGLRVLALCPGATATEFFDVVGTTEAAFGTPQAAPEVITLALKALDKRHPGPSLVTGWQNRAATVGARLVSRRALVSMVSRVMKAPA